MTNMIMGSFLAVGYLVVFWLFGALIPRKFQSGRFSIMCISGFLLYYTLFEIVAFPMKYRCCSLKQLTIIWGSLLIVLFFWIFWKKRTVLADSIRRIPGNRQKNISLTVLVLVAVALAVFLGLNTNTLSNYDSNNYIGLPVASVYSNTLERVAPYTGKLLKSPNSFYIMNTDTLQSAIVYQVLNVHPLMERKWSFTIVMALLFEMGLYQCAEKFFSEKKEAEKTVFVILADMVLLFSYSLGGVSQYFAYRTYEGKAVIAYFYMTVIFWCCLAIYRKEKSLWPWCGLFLCGTGGIAFSNSALFIVPCMTGLTLFPYILCESIRKKQWHLLKRYIIVLLPSVFWMLISYLV